jgi:AcrR family transcriptional regulator
MVDRDKGRRAYRSPVRDRQRQATRAAVIDGARELFLEQGYAKTSITEIAGAAGVSPETVYAVFGTKREVLRAVVETAATGVEGRAVVDAELLARVRAASDARARLDVMADATLEMLTRVGPLDEVVRAAAIGDEDIASLAKAHEAQRLRDIRVLVGLLAEVGPLRMSQRDAVDVMWALARSTGFYRNLAVDRGWSATRASRALNDAIARTILAD